MNIFSSIISGVKAIFGVSSSSGENKVFETAKGIGTWIDNQQFTDEERATYNKELIPSFQEFMNSTVQENSQRSITRREIALWIMRNWVIMLWISIVCRMVEYFAKVPSELSSFVFNIATSSTMTYLVLGIGGFFFGAHIIRTYQVKQNENKAGG